MPVNLLYTDDVEVIPEDEAEDIQQIVATLKQILSAGQARTGQFRSDVHVKTHGYAQGEFRVLPNLPPELAQGLFQHPAVYSTIVRFSNSNTLSLPDALPDGRGMAIKVLAVHGDMVLFDEERGPTQDFVMINHPVFFARNAKVMLRIEQAVAQAGTNPIAAVQQAVTGGDWNPLNWHWREILTATQIATHLPAHPASNTYYSMAPIRFGKYVAKYRVKPAGDRPDSYLDLIKRLAGNADALRLALEETLQNQELLFEFQVQLRTSQQSMPVEDPTVEWPESESPFRTVAHVLLPRQQIEPLRHQRVYQDLSFNVWHALAAHRPLGGINRVRRSVYPVAAAWRRQQTAAQETN